jgi:hypothetical protein
MTEAEWKLMPAEYLGACDKGCYAPRVMVQGHPAEFGVCGIYVCTGCGHTYPPGCEPEMVVRAGRAAYAFRWAQDGNEIPMMDWPEFKAKEGVGVGI